MTITYRIAQTRPVDDLWRHIVQYSPQTVCYMADPEDKGDYRCFVAADTDDRFAGLCIIDIHRLGFGPLADQTVACLENILVLEQYRRQGIARELLRTACEAAWQAHADHVWWTVDYENTAGIEFYRSMGAVFIPEEDSQADQPEKYYTAALPNPDLAARQRRGQSPPSTC